MLSKNNRQLTNPMNANQRQRCGLRKLTVGVASVLLGTTFFLSGVANADTVSAQGSSTTPTTEQSLVTGETIHSTNSSHQDQQATRGQKQVTTDNQSAAAETVSERSVGAAHAAQRSATNNVDVSNLTFTGSVNGFKNTTAEKAATDTTFKAGNTADLTYTMRGSGDTSKLQNQYWPVTSHYLAMLPAGFRLANGNNSWVTDFPASDYQITALGEVGPDGEYVYLITLDKGL